MLSDAMLRQMVDAMPMPVFVKDGEDRYQYVNRAFETLFQVRKEHIIDVEPAPASEGHSIDLLRPVLPTCPKAFTESTTFCTATGERLVMGVIHGERSLSHRSPELLAAEAELRSARHELARVRETDPVTQCLSRRALRAHTESVLAGKQGGVVRIKVDEFATVVERHGADVGDELLASFSDIVRSTTRPDDLFARVADAEFTLVLRGADREQTASVARRICSTVAETMLDTADEQIRLSVSVGAAFSDDDEAELSTLVDKAEQAMRAATPCRNEAVVV